MALESYRQDKTKEYLAIAEGRVVADSGTIDAPIGLEREPSIKRGVRADGARAVTHYKVLERYEGYSLLSIVLETVRSHQIRLHMAHIGHPLLGDDMYGGSQEKLNRHALHAYNIKMLHPSLHSNLNITAKLPEDMVKLIRKYFEE
jgi:23S rRNA pseudouridine1911/1915/1917 synthase